MTKSVKMPIKRNNPNADKPVYFWFRIPMGNRVCLWGRRHVPDPTDTQA